MHSPLAVALIAILLAPAAGAGTKLSLNVEGTTWAFPDATAKASASTPALGSTKGKDPDPKAVEIVLAPGGLFAGLLDGAPLAMGTYTRKSEFAKKIKLTFDFVSATALEKQYEDEIKATILAEHGLPSTIGLTLVGATGKLVLQPKPKKGLVRAKLSLKFKFEGIGGIPALGIGGAPVKVTGRLKGKSVEIPLADLTGG